MSTHIPVLLDEVVEALQVIPNGRYIDCTVGEGGHAAAVLEHGGCVLGIDIDPNALEEASERLKPHGDKAILINENFINLESIASRYDFVPSSGILFDLGMSSLQLADTERGFSFQVEGPLDMRFDPSQELTAETVVNTFSEPELADIINKYGEERRSSAIAKTIVANRPFNTTTQLASVIARAAGKRGRIHPATKTFQALRIFVNQELERLKAALKQAISVLEAGGRLVVISFHSLEDRLVKDFLKRESQDCICLPNIPICTCNHRASLKLITKKVVTPSRNEVLANPRSRSSKMRVAERI
jgi:16S rRNA (cytosine1402-N4)-methyltransferase